MLNMMLCFVPPTPNLGILVILYHMTLFQIISRSVPCLNGDAKAGAKAACSNIDRPQSHFPPGQCVSQGAWWSAYRFMHFS